MGKPSKLNERRNNTRQLYDRDKMPEGLDPEIWHLTLFFDQMAETLGAVGTAGRPIIYTELSHRIAASNVRENFIHWTSVVTDMIVRFWEYELESSKYSYAINEFCKVDTFDYLMRWVVDQRERQLLIDSGTRVTQADPEIHESRRKPEDTQASQIINKRYSQEELRERMDRFKSERWTGDNQ